MFLIFDTYKFSVLFFASVVIPRKNVVFRKCLVVYFPIYYNKYIINIVCILSTMEIQLYCTNCLVFLINFDVKAIVLVHTICLVFVVIDVFIAKFHDL